MDDLIKGIDEKISELRDYRERLKHQLAKLQDARASLKGGVNTIPVVSSGVAKTFASHSKKRKKRVQRVVPMKNIGAVLDKHMLEVAPCTKEELASSAAKDRRLAGVPLKRVLHSCRGYICNRKSEGEIESEGKNSDRQTIYNITSKFGSGRVVV